MLGCAGLYADEVARRCGLRLDARIIPFRGEYWALRSSATRLVRTLIYPVPDPELPFLGVHLTRDIHGSVDAGPNAVLALAREGYSRSDVDLVHLADVLCINVGWGMGSDGLQYRLDEKASERLGVGSGVAEDVILKVMMGMDELKDMFKTSTEGEPHGVKHPTR